MIPVVICVPVLVNGRAGFTCFLPNIIMLLVHALLLCLLIVVSVLINAIDSELNVGYLLHFLIVVGTLAFLSLGLVGYRRISTRLLMAAFCVWCFTWIGYLLIAIVSVSNEKNLNAMSINGRCPINFWMFDWCKQAQMSVPKDNTKNDTDPTYRKNSTEPKIMDQKIEDSEISYQHYMFLNLSHLEFEISVDENESVIMNKVPVLQNSVSLTDIGGYQTKHSNSEPKTRLAYITGIFLVMVFIMYTYTMYGYTLLKILNQMKGTQIFIIARVPDSEQGRQNQNEEINQTQDGQK